MSGKGQEKGQLECLQRFALVARSRESERKAETRSEASSMAVAMTALSVLL